MIPSVIINKADGALGVASSPNPVGIAAIVFPRLKGPTTPSAQTNPSKIVSTFGAGQGADAAASIIALSKKQVVLVPQAPSTAAAIGAVTYTGTGSLASFVTADSSDAPQDDLNVAVLFTAGGTTGSAGIKYQYSTDAKAITDLTKAWSAVQALGTGLTITIPNTGIVLDLATAKTVVANDRFALQASGPKLTDSDVLTALTALGRSSLPWETVLVVGIDASGTTVSNLDTFLTGLEAQGKYRSFVCGARLRAQDGTETEAAYLTAMATAWGSAASIRGSVTADGSFFTSADLGEDIIRKTSLPYMARLMAVDVTTDAARVLDGPLPSVRIVDADGNPTYHDEAQDPGLDDLRLVALRTVNTKNGVFINNPRVISTPGSDYKYMQQVRTMNRACELAYGELVNILSDGVFTDLTTGKIRADSADSYDSRVNNAVRAELGKKVPYVGFALSLDDVLTPPDANLTGTITIVMPVYVKGVLVMAKFQRTVTAAA